MSHAFRDIGQAFSRFNLWVRMSVTDMQQTYKRSIVGIAWIAFAFGLFVAVKALIFGSFAPGEPGEYMMWLTIGLWMFYFLQQLVVDGSNVFIQSRNWLRLHRRGSGSWQTRSQWRLHRRNDWWAAPLQTGQPVPVVRPLPAQDLSLRAGACPLHWV